MRHTPGGHIQDSAAFDTSIGRKIFRSRFSPISSEAPEKAHHSLLRNAIGELPRRQKAVPEKFSGTV